MSVASTLPMTSSSLPPMSPPRLRRDASWPHLRPPFRRPRGWPFLGRPPQRRSSRRRHQTRPRWIRGHLGRRPTSNSPLRPPLTFVSVFLLVPAIGHLGAVHKEGDIVTAWAHWNAHSSLRTASTSGHAHGHGAHPGTCCACLRPAASALQLPPAAINYRQSAHLPVMKKLPGQFGMPGPEYNLLLVFIPCVHPRVKLCVLCSRIFPASLALPGSRLLARPRTTTTRSCLSTTLPPLDIPACLAPCLTAPLLPTRTSNIYGKTFQINTT
ncbi:uncharacterized protein LOC133638527 [Entelurus aequoreus]|uniref:uncharacterized protein LOC133638527 n=1 Tax=Entelurus aequoreus TaxID=161455 RepID=UPI002B1D02D6|nr:uncharacterized protein LOC133638527 [Entelurus aequoreus]